MADCPTSACWKDYWNCYCEATNGPASFNVQLDKICPAWAYATFYVQLDTVHIRVLLALALLPHGVVLRVVRSQIPIGAVPVAATPLSGARPDPLGLALS